MSPAKGKCNKWALTIFCPPCAVWCPLEAFFLCVLRYFRFMCIPRESSLPPLPSRGVGGRLIKLTYECVNTHTSLQGGKTEGRNRVNHTKDGPILAKRQTGKINEHVGHSLWLYVFLWLFDDTFCSNSQVLYVCVSPFYSSVCCFFLYYLMLYCRLSSSFNSSVMDHYFQL